MRISILVIALSGLLLVGCVRSPDGRVTALKQLDDITPDGYSTSAASNTSPPDHKTFGWWWSNLDTLF